MPHEAVLWSGTSYPLLPSVQCPPPQARLVGDMCIGLGNVSMPFFSSNFRISCMGGRDLLHQPCSFHAGESRLHPTQTRNLTQLVPRHRPSACLWRPESGDVSFQFA